MPCGSFNKSTWCWKREVTMGAAKGFLPSVGYFMICDFGPPPLFQSTSLSAVKVGFYEIYARRTRSVLMICLHYFLRAPLLWIFSCSIFLYYLPTSLKGLLLWVLLVCSFRADKLRNIRLNSIKNLCSVFDWITDHHSSGYLRSFNKSTWCKKLEVALGAAQEFQPSMGYFMLLQ